MELMDDTYLNIRQASSHEYGELLRHAGPNPGVSR